MSMEIGFHVVRIESKAGGRGARALFQIPMADTVIPSGGIRIFSIFKFKTLSHRPKNNHEVT